MAVICCTEHFSLGSHRWRGVYGQPARDLRCEAAGCGQQAVVWLDPEELREYEHGTRIFWETGTLMKVRVDERPLVGLDAWEEPPPASARGRKLSRFRPYQGI